MQDECHGAPAISPLRQEGHAAYVPFGQEEAASDVVRLLDADESVKIAVAGDYGSGKSELLHQLENAIDTPGRKAWHVVRYEPWRYAPNATTLRRTFINQVLRDTPDYEGKPAALRPRPSTLRLERTEPVHLPLVKSLNDLARPLTIFLIFTVLALALWALIRTIAQAFGLDLPDMLLAVVLAFAAAIATALGDRLVRQTFNLTFGTVERTESIAITEIDDFEESYSQVLTGLHRRDPNSRLVVLIDDLDRCAPQEIRLVLGGLATYLGKRPAAAETPVSFVVALDADRTEVVLDGALGAEGHNDTAKGRSTWGRFNLVGKYFDAIIPVPIPTLEQWKRVLAAHARALEWILNPSRLDRMARVSAIRCGFNLRELQSSLVEASLIRWYWQARPKSIDDNVRRILDDDVLLLYAAFLRVGLRGKALGELLQGPLRQTVRGTDAAARDLIEEFLRQQLDPRPVLAVGESFERVLHMENFPHVARSFGSSDDVEFAAGCPIDMLEPDTAMQLASYVVAYASEQGDQESQQRAVSRMGTLLRQAKGSLRSYEADFIECMQWYGAVHRKAPNPAPQTGSAAQRRAARAKPPETAEVKLWAELACEAGPRALKCALTEHPVLADEGSRLQVLEVVAMSIRASNESDDLARQRAECLTEGAILHLESSPNDLADVVQMLAKTSSYVGWPNVERLGRLSIAVLSRWSQAERAEMPDFLVGDAARRSIVNEQLAEEAHSIFVRMSNWETAPAFYQLMSASGWSELPPRREGEDDLSDKAPSS